MDGAGAANGVEASRRERQLEKWQRFLLRFAAAYNAGAGLLMIFGTRYVYLIIGLERGTTPDWSFPMKLVGLLVALFGLGYYLVSREPVENRNLLTLGFLSKFGATVLSLFFMCTGKIPWYFLPTLIVCDTAYLPPFWIIMRRLYRLAAERDRRQTTNNSAFMNPAA